MSTRLLDAFLRPLQRPSQLVRSAAHSASQIFALGDFSVTVLSDGHLVVPSAFLARNAPRQKLEEAMTIAGQGGERVNAPTNITLVRTKSDLILIDAGSGPHFMVANRGCPQNGLAASRSAS